MRQWLRPHVTFANVVSMIALFVALSGVAWAAATIGADDIKRNAVRSRHIQNGQVKRGDIRNDAVNSAKVEDNGLTRADLAPATVPTVLFGYIRDSSVGTATVEYGRGVTQVSDPSGDNSYTLTFSRSVVNCVVQAVGGIGKPSSGGSAGFNVIPFVYMFGGNDHQVDVSFLTHAGAPTDTAFLVTAFC